MYCAPFCAWVKLPMWVFITVRSGAVALTVVGSVAVSLTGVVSPPPLTVTVLFPVAAVADKLTVSVIAG